MARIVPSALYRVAALTVAGVVAWRSDRVNLYYTGRRRLFRDGTLVREKFWDEAIPRDHQ